MEGCPDEDLNILYMIISAFIGVFIFVFVKAVNAFTASKKQAGKMEELADMLDDEFEELQVEMFGERGRARFKHLQSTLSNFSNASKHSKKSDA